MHLNVPNSFKTGLTDMTSPNDRLVKVKNEKKNKNI